MMRTYHRWFSFPLIIFLLLVTVTGVYLQAEEMGGLFNGEQPKPALVTLPDDAALADSLQSALVKARAVAPDFKPQRIELTFAEGRQVARFAVAPRGGPSVEVDLQSGKTTYVAKPAMPLHVIFIQLHTGRMGGGIGLVLVMLSGLALLFLAVSGIILYYRMWRNRTERGLSGMFWK